MYIDWNANMHAGDVMHSPAKMAVPMYILWLHAKYTSVHQQRLRRRLQNSRHECEQCLIWNTFKIFQNLLSNCGRKCTQQVRQTSMTVVLTLFVYKGQCPHSIFFWVPASLSNCSQWKESICSSRRPHREKAQRPASFFQRSTFLLWALRELQSLKFLSFSDKW